MADCQRNNASADNLQIPSTAEASIVEQITKTIVELNTCRKIVLMYPPEHVQVQRSLKQAWEVLNQAMNSQPELTIGIAKDTLLVGGKPLDSKNPICRDFALILTRREIASLKFISGVTTDELRRFLLLIAAKPDQIHAKGGIRKISLEYNLAKIQIQSIDYGKFQFTEEAEIADAPTREGQTKRKPIWHNYIIHLLSGTLSESENGKSLSKFGELDPIQVAELLNGNEIDPDEALRAYREILKNLAGHIGAHHPGTSPSGRTGEHPHSTDLSRPSAGHLQNLSRLLQELNPDLRRQFLAVTFQHCNSDDASNWADEFLGNFSDNLVVDMLRQANKEGKEISPTLLRFIEKFSNSGMSSAIEPAPNGNDPVDDPRALHNSAENLQGLFQRESYEDYVVSEYNTQLQKFVQEKQTVETDAKELLADQNILESLEDSQLCAQIAMLLLGFLKPDLDQERYRVYAAKLVGIGHELLEAGHLLLLWRILNRFGQHSRKPVGNDIRAIAAESIESWQDPAFTSKAVEALLGCREPIDPNFFDFLIALGPQIVPDLVNAYGKRKNAEAGESIIRILAEFKAEAVKEARKRLRDTRPDYVCNLVEFLRRIDAREALPQLRSLMETGNTKVQMEVLVALLKFGDGWAPVYLRKALQSNRTHIASQAIAMAAKHKVRDMVPDLVAMLKPRVVFKSDFQKNEEIIEALGQIGDSAAIPTLEKLAKSNGLFHQEEQLHMKQVLFGSLKGYPLEAVGNLLEIGQNSKDKSIRDACRTILTGEASCSN